jgi:protein SCO1/2
MRSAAVAGIAAGAIALGVTAWLLLDARAPAPPAPPAIGGYLVSPPRALPAVELVNEDGAPFRTADFAGHWSFLYFGYTYCPDVCPLTLVELANLKRTLAAERVDARAEYYLVSVDPERDTPERLREYVAYFDAELRALTGGSNELAVLAEATETLFDVPESDGGEHYLVSHSSNVVLLDPRGRVHAVFTPPQHGAALAADFTKVVALYDGAR